MVHPLSDVHRGHATAVGCITLPAVILNRAEFWCQLWTRTVAGEVGGKHVGRNPLPASFTEDVTSRELMVGMENLKHLCLEAGCVIQP